MFIKDLKLNTIPIHPMKGQGESFPKKRFIKELPNFIQLDTVKSHIKQLR